MIIEKPRVKWPPIVALLEDATHALQLRFVEEKSLFGEVELGPERPGAVQLPIKHLFKSGAYEAHYLPRVYIRLQAGTALPKGRLTVILNDEIVAEDTLERFLLPEEPVNCETVLHGFKDAKNNFKATWMMDEKNCDSLHSIGLMIPNDTPLQVQLSELDGQEKVTLEVGALIGLYSTRAKQEGER